jgi:hypothetical protein
MSFLEGKNVPPFPEGLQTVVQGSIRGPVTAEGGVPCWLEISGQQLDFTFPASVFEPPIRYGRPFQLAMQDSDNRSTLKATWIDPPPLSAEDEELYALLTQVLKT